MPERVLDVGTGSGILALAALRLGSRAVVGYDTDPLAVEAARANAERNGLGDRLDVRDGTLPALAGERYPLLLANLVAALLVELAPRLVAHLEPSGVLLASGIVTDRADEVIAALEGAGLIVTDQRDDGDWVALRLEAPQ
jgi:ribosomal protein L11 methyltransferase